MKISADFTTPITRRKRRSMNCFERPEAQRYMNENKEIFLTDATMSTLEEDSEFDDSDEDEGDEHSLNVKSLIFYYYYS